MKCLSIRQPWASLIVAGIKPVENRSRPTEYRGPMLIHAAKTSAWPDFLARPMPLPDKALSDFVRIQGHKILRDRDFPTGAIIGQVDLVDCVQDHDSPWAEAGAWHWVLANPRALDTPVLYPGRLGLFDAPDPDAQHLFKPHDGTTRRVCLTQEPCDVVITRPGFWGNPYKVVESPGGWRLVYTDGVPYSLMASKKAALWSCLHLYRDYVCDQLAPLTPKLAALKGKRLGCFCPPGQPCHGDVLVELVGELVVA